MYGLCCTQSCQILCSTMDCGPPGSSVHGDSPGKNIGAGCHALFRGIFPTQVLNPVLPHYRQIIYHLSHEGHSWILERVVHPFSRGSSQPRNWARVSCMAGRFFTSWATRESHKCVYLWTIHLLLEIYSKKKKNHRSVQIYIWPRTFTVVFYITLTDWKQPKWSLIGNY